MELTDLKSTWKNAGEAIRNEAGLRHMIKEINHPVLKKIKAKLVIETVALTLFLFVYKDAFDGDEKPFMANLLLVGSVLLYIVNNIIGYISMARPVAGGDLKTALKNHLGRIRRLCWLSLLIAFLYTVAITIFFTTVIVFSPVKYVILAGVIATLLLLNYVSLKNWMRWINRLKQQAADFD